MGSSGYNDAAQSGGFSRDFTGAANRAESGTGMSAPLHSVTASVGQIAGNLVRDTSQQLAHGLHTPPHDTLELNKSESGSTAPGRWQKFKNVLSCFWESIRNVFSKKSKTSGTTAQTTAQSIQQKEMDLALNSLKDKINT